MPNSSSLVAAPPAQTARTLSARAAKRSSSGSSYSTVFTASASRSHWSLIAKRRVLTVATWLWVGVFALRLAVQAPLYFTQQTELLAAMKLLMGVPLYAAMLWVTWLLVTSVYRRAGEPPPPST